MKNTRKYLSLLLIFVMILSSITVFYISAAELLCVTDIAVVESEDIVIEHELVPVKANECDDIGGWNGSYPGNDGSVAPGAGWEWRGSGAPGSNAGSWIIPNTLYYLWGHLTNDGGGHGPHWDYRDGNGIWYRIFPDGRYELK